MSRSHNLPSFRTCSQMLASLSGYQYTRKAWKKEVFDLLLDPTYFQMDEVCIGYWRIVIDNLMTHDRTTFRDLLGKDHGSCERTICGIYFGDAGCLIKCGGNSRYE